LIEKSRVPGRGKRLLFFPLCSDWLSGLLSSIFSGYERGTILLDRLYSSTLKMEAKTELL
jgi:hypothetical protein